MFDVRGHFCKKSRQFTTREQDHGKSSLASRVLEYTGNMGRERQSTARRLGRRGGPSADDDDDDDERTSPSDRPPSRADATTTATNDDDGAAARDANDAKEEITLLDTLAVERERGITVRASAASMLYRHRSSSHPDKWILLNMVDTPGHVDFGMEVSKSLDSVEGAVLLFDSAQGVQAQTLSVHDKARMIGRLRREAARMTAAGSKGDRGDEGDRERVNGNDDDDDDRGGDGGGDGEAGDFGGMQILPALTKVDMASARPVSGRVFTIYDPHPSFSRLPRTIRTVTDEVFQLVPSWKLRWQYRI